MDDLTPEEQQELAALEAQGAKQDPLRKMIGKSNIPEMTPEEGQDLVAAMGSSMPGAGEGGKIASKIAEKTGLSKIPDYLMQKAVGMKKYVPEIGERLMDMGVFGTKSGMQKQIGSKLATEGEGLAKAVGGIEGKVPSQPIAESVQEQFGKKFTTPAGVTPEMAEPMAQTVDRTVTELVKRGEVAPTEALALKRIAGETGYNVKGEPLDQLKSRIARQVSKGYGTGLEEAYATQNPGAANLVKDQNKKLEALIRGQKGLSSPDTIGKIGMSDIAAGAVGGSIGGLPGIIGSVAAKKAAQSPLVKSAAAYTTRGAGQLAKGTAEIGTRAGVGQLLRPNTKTTNDLTPEEEAELQALEAKGQ